MYRSHRSRLLQRAFSVLFFTYSIDVLADETQLQEVVVTASLGKNLLDIAQPTAVLEGDDLSRRLAGSLGETLSGQLGVSSSYFGPTASRPVIRGMGGYRVQTLQDGLATLDVGSLSDDHASTIDPSLAEQVEILKGPATLLYGSGASGGLVNVVTHRIPIKGATAFDGSAEVRGGTAADERAGVFAVNTGRERIAMHADLFKSKSGAIDIPGGTVSDRLIEQLSAAGETVETHQGEIPNAGTDVEGGALGASWIEKNGLVGGSVSRYEAQYGIPSEETAFIDMQQNRYEAKAEWRTDRGWLRAINLNGAYNDYTHTEFEAPGIPGTVFNQDAFEIRVAANHVHTDAWRGTFGIQVTHLDFSAEGDEAFVPASVTKSIGVFALEEFDAGEWTFSVGARGEQQRIDAALPTAASSFDNKAASFSAGGIVALSDVDTLAISLTHSARHPQATELYANGPHIAAQRFEIGDATLDTETSNTIDISLRRNNGNDAINWLLNAFYNDYENFVFAAPTGEIEDELPIVRYLQSAAKTYGYEAELWVPLYHSEVGSVRLRVMSDYVRGERSEGERLPQMPPLRIGTGVHFDQTSWHVEVEAIHNARQDRLASNELATDGYLMLNADLSYSLETAAGDCLLFVRATNLLDEEARQHTSSVKDLVPLPGRSINAGIRLAF